MCINQQGAIYMQFHTSWTFTHYSFKSEIQTQNLAHTTSCRFLTFLGKCRALKSVVRLQWFINVMFFVFIFSSKCIHIVWIIIILAVSKHHIWESTTAWKLIIQNIRGDCSISWHLAYSSVKSRVCHMLAFQLWHVTKALPCYILGDMAQLTYQYVTCLSFHMLCIAATPAVK